MRTNFQQRSRQGKTRMVVAGIFVALCLLLFFFNTALGGITSTLLFPVHALRIWIAEGESAIPTYIRSKQSLQEEIVELKAQLSRAGIDAMRLNLLEDENRDLRGLSTSSPIARHLAQVIRVPSETPYDTLVIASGYEDGIQEGALVYADAAAIGSVARAYAQSSIIVLFSTPGVVTPVYLDGADVFARAMGQGGGVLRIGVPQGILLNVGDAVTIPFPYASIYGSIQYVESNASDPEQYAYATQMASLRGIRTIAVDYEPLPDVTYEDAVSAVQAYKKQMQTSSVAPLIEAIPDTTLPVTATTSTSTGETFTP